MNARGDKRMGAVQWAVIVLYLAATVSGLTLFKLGANEAMAQIGVQAGVLGLRLHVKSLIGMVLYVVSFLLYLYLVSGFDLTWIYPVTTGVVYILVFVCGFVFLGEPVSMGKILGGALVLAGIAVINFSGKGG